MRRVALAALATCCLVYNLPGCVQSSTANQPVRPEITSMMELTSFPGATTLSTNASGGSGPLGAEPTKWAVRKQRTTRSAGAVFAHYRSLAARNAQHGWTFSGSGEDVDTVPDNYEGPVNLSLALQDKMSVAISVQPDFDWAPSSPQPSDAASASPEPSPTPRRTRYWTIEQNFQVR